MRTSNVRGYGDHQAAEVVYLLSYYGLMLPAGYALAFHYGCGVKGIWRPGDNADHAPTWFGDDRENMSIDLPSY